LTPRQESKCGIVKHWHRFIKLAISIALVGTLIHWADTDALLAHLTTATAPVLFGALMLLVLQFFVVSGRWWAILAALRTSVPLSRINEICVASVFANTMLVNTISGIAVRLFLVMRNGVGFVPAAASIALERLITLGVLAVATLIGTPVALDIAGIHGNWAIIGAALTVAALTLAGAIATRAGGVHFVARKLKLEAALGDLRTILFNFRAMSRFVGLTALSQLLGFAAILLLAQGLGIKVPVLGLLGLLPAIALLSGLPISVGGWGVREGGMVAGLHLFGVAMSDALALSILYAVLGLICIAVAGGIVGASNLLRHDP
jgi:uncharacterized membrane protein YbhN (UPF0104 family)